MPCVTATQCNAYATQPRRECADMSGANVRHRTAPCGAHCTACGMDLTVTFVTKYIAMCMSVCVRPLLIIGVERDYLRGTICLVPSLTTVHVSSVHVYLCVCA